MGCSFSWSDEELEFLEGSSAVAAARSLQTKVRNAYDWVRVRLRLRLRLRLMARVRVRDPNPNPNPSPNRGPNPDPKVANEYATLRESTLEPNAARFPAERYTFELFEWAMVLLF